jgi:hypothetical protein
LTGFFRGGWPAAPTPAEPRPAGHTCPRDDRRAVGTPRGRHRPPAPPDPGVRRPGGLGHRLPLLRRVARHVQAAARAARRPARGDAASRGELLTPLPPRGSRRPSRPALNYLHRQRIVEFAAARRLPALYTYRESVEAAGS